MLYFFYIANDQLDVNSAEKYELKTIKGIGDAIAENIYNKRPFKDETDLFSQVRIPENAKKRVKVMKNIGNNQ